MHAGTQSPKANTTVSLKEFLKSSEYLFDMTAQKHGKSASTTSQEEKKRPTIFCTCERPREEPEPSAATKKAKCEAKGQTKGCQGEGEDDQDTSTKNKERTFKMTRWETVIFIHS